MASRTRLSLTTVLLFAAALLCANSAKIQRPSANRFVGGVYVMSNELESNNLIAYGRYANGTLSSIGSFKTGGKGAILDDFDDIDPLFSAYSVVPVLNNKYIINVNAGSNTVSVFRVLPNFRLRLASVTRVPGVGPVSIAYFKGIVYVASVEADRIEDPSLVFSYQGLLTGFKLTKFGKLIRLQGSERRLTNRPAAIQFSPDGRSLVVSSVSAGSAQLDTTDVDEIAVYRVFATGRLSRSPIDTATSTLPNNPEGRSIPGAIGFEIVKAGRNQYVVVAEPRFQGVNGDAFDPQVSSISIWRLTSKQKFVPVQLDVPVGTQLAACWIEFSKNEEYFWLANTISGTVSSFSFRNGRAELVEEVAGESEIPIDLWRSADGKFLYQLRNGAVDAYEIANGGNGAGLEAIQTVTNIPAINVQGIVAI